MKPWEKYQAAQQGPWMKYAAAPSPQKDALGRSLVNIQSDDEAYRRSPVADASPGERRLAGIGQAFMGLRRGIDQLAIDPKVTREDVDEARRLDAPLLASKEGGQGALIGNLAATAPLMAVPGAATIRGAAAIGGVLGAAQPVGTSDSRALNAGMGAAVSGATAGTLKGLGKIAKPIAAKLKPAAQRAVSTLESEGVTLDAAQKSGSPVLQRIKSVLKDNPITLGAETEKVARQQSQFNRAVLSKMGVTADVADEAAMATGKANLSRTIDDVIGKYSIKFNAASNAKAAALEARANRLPNKGGGSLQAFLKDIREHVAANGGKMDGRYYQALRSELGGLEREPTIGVLLRELREGLDTSFQQVAGKDGPRLAEALGRWRNMRIIEAAIDTEGAGNISAAKLANQFGTKANRAAGVYGQAGKSTLELARLAKAGKQLIPDKLPNSGTAARSIAQLALPAGVGAAYGGIKEGDWQGMAAYGGAGLLAPKAAQMLINSRGGTNYLTRGMFPELPGVAQNMLLRMQQGANVAAPAYLLPQITQ